MKQLDPKAVWLFFITSIFGWMFMGIFFIVWGTLFFGGINFTFNGEQVSSFRVIWTLVKFFIPFILIFAYVWSKLSYKYYRYDLASEGFKKESGVIWKSYVTIPYHRIQNVDIYRGLIARLMGLSDLHIHTAGAGGVPMGEGRLPGLSKEAAEQLRSELVAKIDTKAQGL